MKKLETADVLQAMRIVKAAGLSEEVARIGASISPGKALNAKEIGLQLILSCIEKCAGKDAEKELYIFIGSLLEISPADVAHMDPFELCDKLVEYKNSYEITSETAKRFFGLLQRLLGQ